MMDDFLESEEFIGALNAHSNAATMPVKETIIREIKRMIRANCAPTWQPIDTAPKDRSDVWLFCPNDEPQQCVGFFCNGDGGYWEPTEKLVADVVGAIEPTHWMPLPDAPKVEDGKP